MNPFDINIHPPGEHISDFIREHGFWEPYGTEILLELIRMNPKHIFVDIGANIGWYSLVAASEGMKVVAFEPIIDNFLLFQKSIRANSFGKLITTHAMAVGDKKREITLNIWNKNMGLASIRDLPEGITDRSVSVWMEKLDEFNIPFTYKGHLIVKIDVEESELQVLQGMTRTLQFVDYLIIEISIYRPEIFEILRKSGLIYVINIGYCPEDGSKTEIERTEYLQQEKYHSNIDKIEQEMIKDQVTNNPQRNYLFYKKPFK
jgi:FkbM family methyltransferase